VRWRGSPVIGPLNGHPDAATFRKLSEEPAYRDLIDVTVREPIDEKSIAEHVEEVAPVADAVSLLVRQQYEENPYPAGRPRERRRRLTRRGEARARKEHSRCPAAVRVERRSTRRSSSRPRVWTAIDLSRASLAYATRKAAELRVANVFFRQPTFSTLRGSGRASTSSSPPASCITCETPSPGLRALLAVLAPGGALKIALTARLRARPSRRPREWARRTGFVPTPQGIRHFRAAVSGAPRTATS